ncbi:MAG TPA: AMP-binding protein [Gammaproteobacteria bacterium]|nr:AMP-binding protein [Gammaproteobacteria bacterium]
MRRNVRKRAVQHGGSTGITVWRQELSPVNFLERSGTVHADRVAVVDGDVRYTWRHFRARSRRLASALRGTGLRKGDRIAFLACNCEPLLLAHFGVAQAGGVLVAINTRLSSDEIAYIIEDSGAGTVFYTPELEKQLSKVPRSVCRLNTRRDLEEFLTTGADAEVESWLTDENDLITINYTSGTTGRPRGVMYHHRGAYLNALAMALGHGLTAGSAYLWTLPMFHCNGWTFPWALAAVGARSICISRIEPEVAWRLFDEDVSHFCAAPTVLSMLANSPAAHRLKRSVRLLTAGAPPSPALISRMTELNFELDHVYGLTETYGPFTINVSQPNLVDLTPNEQARIKARQGFPNVCAGDVRVIDEAMRDVPADGRTMGEVVMRGNAVMCGYFADEKATSRAFDGGWFHSGDLAVRHPDCSIELRDRKKDIIILGGENVSTIEVEQAVSTHPAVLECAVIAVPNDTWGEVPKAFVTLKLGATASEADIIEHCRSQIAHFKVPTLVEFGPLPKTSTGKVQKYILREREWRGRERRIN